MQCFNHHDRQAVGLCKCCLKGLCADCAIDLGHGIACQNHQEKVSEINNLIDNNIEKKSSTNAHLIITPIIYCIFGVVFIPIAVGSGSVIPWLMATAFMGFGGYLLITALLKKK